MRKQTLIWGWLPPHYENLGDGQLRLFYHSEQRTRTVEHIDEETGKSSQDEVTEYLCDVAEDSYPELMSAIRRADTDSLEFVKNLRTAQLMAYDGSRHVNVFSIGGTDMWLDKDTRAGLKLRFEAELAAGREGTVLWKDGTSFPLSLADAASMLNAIELYASACYDQTQKHLSAIQSLTDAKEVAEYDYTQGYPEKLAF
ncbi:MAG: DUF4376 domain-containing protein [Bacteroides sp.]